MGIGNLYLIANLCGLSLTPSHFLYRINEVIYFVKYNYQANTNH